jgi:hypothetical protein
MRLKVGMKFKSSLFFIQTSGYQNHLLELAIHITPPHTKSIEAFGHPRYEVWDMDKLFKHARFGVCWRKQLQPSQAALMTTATG